MNVWMNGWMDACMHESLLLIDLLIARAVVHALVRVHGTGGVLARIRADAAVVTVVIIVVHGILRLFLAVPSGAKEKPEAAAAGQQDQDHHGTNNRRAASTSSCLVLDNGAADTHQADIDAKLRFGVLQPTLRRASSDRNHGKPRLVPAVIVVVVTVVLLGCHKRFDVVGAEQTTDRSTETARRLRGRGARHE
jgi:hypothetical protein